MSDPGLIQALVVGAVFLLAGFVKGVVGLGLPTVALGLLTAVAGLKGAMALLLVPSFTTNLWQAVGNGPFVAVGRRLGALLLAVVGGTGLGMLIFVRADPADMSLILGILIAAYGALGLTPLTMPRVGRHEGWLGPAVGTVNGVLTGMTGSFVVPGVFYLQALGLDRESFVKAMGILFTVSTLALGGALVLAGQFAADLGVLSLLACVPAFAGMWLGAKVRHRLSERVFRKVFFAALVLLGGYIAVRQVI